MPQEAQYPPTLSPTELMRVVEAVAENGRRTVVHIHGTPVDIAPHATPKRARRKTPSPEAIAAALAAAGSWKGLVDPDQLKRDLDEARGSDSSPLTL